MKRLSKNLKLIRKESWGITQEKFAKLLDSSRGKISSYENDDVEPSIAFMIKLQKITNISIEDLFTKQLKIENISPGPFYQKKETIIEIEEEAEDYELARKNLDNYHLKLSHRFKNIEKRLDKLEKEKKASN